MKKTLAIILAVISIPWYSAFAAGNTEVETQLREKPLRVLGEKRLFLSSYYEYSRIHQGTKKGLWRLSTTTAGYSFDNGLIPYLEVDAWDRFHNKDQMINLGAYLKFPDSSYLHSEIGFGNDITYLPRFRFVQEYEHRLAKDLFWQFGYKYLDYYNNDVHIIYPGLVYYFGDNYLSMSFNNSFTQNRGPAYWGTLKGNFVVNDRTTLWLGTAIGERLYDITPLRASKEYGYILFSGIDFKVYKDIAVRFGYSYSRERPDFTKRSIDCGLSIKF